MDELLEDFVVETREMLEALGGELISWEENPGDRARLDSIFRFVHTVKGNCGFVDLPRLEALSHAAEDALADVRAGRRSADAALVSAVLAVVDRIGDMVDAIEAGETFPEGGDEALKAALEPAAAPVVTLVPATPPPISGPRTAQPQRSIRIPVELLDKVMSGVSDMVLARNELARRLREGAVEPQVHEPFERLSAIIAEVREAMTRTRMQRIESLFSGLPRMVRDLAAELGKQAHVDIAGNEVELDREMVEIIRDPLTHIVRNAIDHGIEHAPLRRLAGKAEIGRLSVSARQSGNKILIDIVDDGRGIDETRLLEKAVIAGLVDEAQAARMSRNEAFELIFEPGLSTAETVTAISGRGVGMDVVRANIERIGGAIEIDSTPGLGTRMTLRVPLTLTIIPAVTVGIGNQRFAIPRSSVEEIIHLADGTLEIDEVGGAMLARIREHRVPCLMAAQVLHVAADEPLSDDAARPVIVLRHAGGGHFALIVDQVFGHEELVIKPAAPAIIATGLYAGTTLTDDGHPILLLEVSGIARAGGLRTDALERRDRLEEAPAQPRRTTSVLLFTGLDGIRRAMPMGVLDRLEEVGPEAIAMEGDRRLVVIRDCILPLAGIEDMPLEAALDGNGVLRLLRLADGQNEIAYAVREALEIREIDADAIAAGGAEHEDAVVLVDGLATQVVAPYRLFARHSRTPSRIVRPVCRLPADDAWIQNFVRPMVEAAGYRVVETDTPDEADLAILPHDGGGAPAAPPHGPAREVIRLRTEPGSPEPGDSSIYRYDQAALMGALRRHAGRA
ncbi:two-component system chemotaxis sensor kinase CheA [Novosphingobium sp. PhB165]|uniref:chemotaxis protein CheA n=1 Tax=Novosphingobium sp. PhB165 TaxID=2485105 RepID=UPI0010516720|nr:chemotaxis protein CheA [Novosphingobium sp. PhB165]TCM21348.1 two-component system chemotaxis sensor kinase CheA [Novosphingobium sp. PhB165]